MGAGLFKRKASNGRFIKLPDGIFAKCTCCGEFAEAEPCGDDYEGDPVYFAPGKAPACAYMEVPLAGGRCFKISNTFPPYDPEPGDIYLDIGSPGNPNQYENCCDCDDTNCESTRTSPLASLICPGTLPSFPACCCVADGTVVSGTGVAVEHLWRGSSELVREQITTYTWSWSFTVGSPGSATGTWTKVTEELTRISPGVYDWVTDTDGPFSLTGIALTACPLDAEYPNSACEPAAAYDCGGAGGGVTQSYTEEFDCTGYHGTAIRESGDLDYSCVTGGCGSRNTWEVTITATDVGVPSQCTGGCE